MPIYVYRCACGHQFEKLVPRDAEPPACPQCGRAPHKIPAGSSIGGRTAAASPNDRLAPPWRNLRGNPEGVKREVEFRQRLEAKGTEA